MHRLLVAWIGLSVAALTPACSCNHNGAVMPPGPIDMTDPPPPIFGGDIDITPMEATLDLLQGGTPPSQDYTAKTKAGVDVTTMTAWAVDDASLGSFNGSTFVASGLHGGTTYVRANFQGSSGFATVHVKLHATVPADSCAG